MEREKHEFRRLGHERLDPWVTQGFTLCPMRRFISLLLVISLSWVTTGYACRMDGLDVVRAECCCPNGHEARDHAMPDAKAAVEAEATSSCCDVVADAALDHQQPGLLAQLPALDLPAVALLPSTSWNLVEPAARTVAALPPVRGPPLGSGTRTYLTTARLRL